MLLRLMEEDMPLDVVVFYNTGMEFKSIYDIRDKIIPILNDRGIEYVELHPDYPFLYSMLEKKVKYRWKDGYHYGYGWCGGSCRWATSQKVKAISRFRRSISEESIDYVGIAADEPERLDKEGTSNRRFPLVEWGMTESDCLQYCYKNGYEWTEHSACGDVELYSILDRVSCWCCMNKNLKELRGIRKFLPEYWHGLHYLQDKINTPFKKPYTVDDLEIRFSLEELYMKRGRSITGKEFYKELSDIINIKKNERRVY